MKNLMLILSMCLSIFTHAQFDSWECDHYSSYATDSCIPYSSTFDYWFECNGTDKMVFKAYVDTGGECGAVDDPWSIISYDLTDIGDIAQCGNEQPCDYYGVMHCDGYLIYGPVIVDQCYSGDSTSVEYSCQGNYFQTRTWTENGECEGNDYTQDTSDMRDMYSGDCYTVRYLHVISKY